jgi:hypothetical protein
MPLNNSSTPRSGELGPGRLDHPATLDVLFIGGRVCVRERPQTCGEVVRVMPMMGRVIVRLDPRHPSWRGTLRSFRPERLVIYS